MSMSNSRGKKVLCHLGKLLREFLPAKKVRKNSATTKWRPTFELLEGRLVPATHIWAGAAGGLWSVAGNWTGGVPTTGEGPTIVQFGSTGGATSTDDIVGLVVDEIYFTTGGHTISGTTPLGLAAITGNQLQNDAGTNTLSSTLPIVLSGSTAFIVITAGQVNIQGDISGTTGFRLSTGSVNGTLQLQGNNTFNGTTDVQDGTLLLNSGTTNGAVPGTLLVGNGTGAAGSAVVKNLASDQIANSSAVNVKSDGLYDLGSFAEQITSLTTTGAGVIANTGGGTNLLNITGNASFGGTVTAGALSVSGTTAINTTNITTTGAQDYTGPTTLGVNGVLAGSTISFYSTVTGNAHNLAITGNAAFDNTVSTIINLSVSGTTAINTPSITTTGTQDYTGAATLGAGANEALSGTTITFHNALTGDSHNLTITGNAAFGNTVSTIVNLSVSGATAINTTSITTTGTQMYASVALGASPILTGTSVAFSGTVQSPGTAFGLTVNTSGVTTFGGAVGGGGNPLGALTTNAGGSTQINGGSVNTTGFNQTYNDDVTLGTPTTVLSGGILFNANLALGTSTTTATSTLQVTGTLNLAGTTTLTSTFASSAQFGHVTVSNLTNFNNATLALNYASFSPTFGDSFNVVSNGSAGTGQFANAPAPGPVSLSGINYLVNYSGGTSHDLVLTVLGTPTADAQSVALAENATNFPITLTGSDPNTPALSLTYTVSINPTHGTLSGTGANLTYTPAVGYFGSDSFQFTDSNGTATSAAATVSITVVGTPSVTLAENATNYVTTTTGALYRVDSTGSHLLLSTNVANTSFTNESSGVVLLVTTQDGALYRSDSTGNHLVMRAGIASASITFEPTGEVLYITTTTGALYRVDSTGNHLVLSNDIANASITFGAAGEVLLVTTRDGALYRTDSTGSRLLLSGNVANASITNGSAGEVIFIITLDGALYQADSTGNSLRVRGGIANVA